MRRLGFQLAQTAVALAILAVVLAVATPPLLHWSSALRLRLAAGELVTALRLARMAALQTSAKVGLKFRSHEDGRVTFTLHRDGDGDGVRSADIIDGTDPQIGPERQLQHVGAHVRLGFPPGPPPRDPGDPSRHLDRLDDPIRFNNSDIAAFSPLGQATPGSLYLTDGVEGLVVVRVLGRTGRVRVLVYDGRREVWVAN
jgi:type II secretory pathway pseudopilin PulG